jgi:hypothetical protein
MNMTFKWPNCKKKLILNFVDIIFLLFNEINKLITQD